MARLARQHRRYRRQLWVLAGVVVLILVAGAAVATWAWGWMSAPASHQEIVASWARVEGWAEPESGVGPMDGLLEAQRALPAHEDARDLTDDDATPRLELGDAPGGVPQAIEALERWHREGGGIQTCDRRIEPLRLFQLGLWALATATSEDVKRARAVVHLASVLRSAGNALQGAIGAKLSEEVLRWAEDRGVGHRALGDGLPPRPGEAFRALARDTVCLYGLLDLPPLPEQEPLVLTSAQRQAAMLQWYFSDPIVRAYPHRMDTAELAEFLREENRRLDEAPPPSAMAKATAVAFPVRAWLDYEQAWLRAAAAR